MLDKKKLFLIFNLTFSHFVIVFVSKMRNFAPENEKIIVFQAILYKQVIYNQLKKD